MIIVAILVFRIYCIRNIIIMESNQSCIMGHSKTPDVKVGVKINEIKPVAREAGS